MDFPNQSDMTSSEMEDYLWDHEQRQYADWTRRVADVHIASRDEDADAMAEQVLTAEDQTTPWPWFVEDSTDPGFWEGFGAPNPFDALPLPLLAAA